MLILILIPIRSCNPDTAVVWRYRCHRYFLDNNYNTNNDFWITVTDPDVDSNANADVDVDRDADAELRVLCRLQLPIERRLLSEQEGRAANKTLLETKNAKYK
mgnify:CR=1 FL=1